MKKGTLLTAIWLIAVGLTQAIALSFQGMNIVLGVLAVVAGILTLMNK